MSGKPARQGLPPSKTFDPDDELPIIKGGQPTGETVKYKDIPYGGLIGNGGYIEGSGDDPRSSALGDLMNLEEQ